MFRETHFSTPQEVQTREKPFIMVADKDWETRETLVAGLSKQGFDVLPAEHWARAQQLAVNFQPKLMVVDVEGFGIGLDQFKRFSDKTHTPIIILSEHSPNSSHAPKITFTDAPSAYDADQLTDEEKNRLKHIQAGADFSLLKPIHPNVLAAYIRASIRSRKQKPDKDIHQLAIGLQYDLRLGVFYENNRPVESLNGALSEGMTETERNLLSYLLRNRGKIHSWKDVLTNIWGPEYTDDTQYLRAWVSRVRVRLESFDLGGEALIRTVQGVGYGAIEERRWEEEIADWEVIMSPEKSRPTGKETASKKKILAIDSDPGSLNLLRYTIPGNEFSLRTAPGRMEAEALMETYIPDVILVGDGYVVASQDPKRSIPWISLVSDPLHGPGVMELGAVNFMEKPVGPNSMGELIAKMNVIERRSNKEVEKPIIYGGRGVVVDLNAKRVEQHGGDVNLTRIEHQLLFYLAEHQGKVVGNSNLLTRVWGPEYSNDLQYLRVLISRIRAKLGDQGDSERPIQTHPYKVIETIQGVGYRFLDPEEKTEKNIKK